MQDKIETDEVFDRLYGVPVLGGLLAGIVSFVLGGVTFIGLAAATGDGFNFDAPIVRIKQDLHTFYNGFRVSTYERSTVRTIQEAANASAPVEVEEIREMWFNPFLQTQEIRYRVLLNGSQRSAERTSGSFSPELTFSPEVYLAIPVVLLIAVGAVLAYRFVDMEEATEQVHFIQRVLLVGVTMALGFLLVALVGTYLFEIRPEDGRLTRPDQLDVLVWGLAYPVILGTAGAILGLLPRRSELDQPASEPTDASSDGTGDDTDTDTQ